MFEIMSPNRFEFMEVWKYGTQHRGKVAGSRILLPSIFLKATRNNIIMDDEERQVKPNSAFLGRLVGGVTRGNQRVIDSIASRAAQKVGGKGVMQIPLHATRRLNTVTLIRGCYRLSSRY